MKNMFFLATMLVLFSGMPVFSADMPSENSSTLRLTKLSLEELMEIEIISVSKIPESSLKAASAIHVITHYDISRSGVTSLPEALRLAPGVQVSRIDGNKWAISIRGAAGRFSNKLLVLQDGRTLYNPVFSGVYWNAQEIMLEDIDRIEVIRGPGATLWGANGVNGVVNIITRSAKDTQGGLLAVSGGSWERAATALRYGIKQGNNGYMRLYGKFFYRDGQPPVSTTDMEGYWNDWRTGFRGDWELGGRNSLTVQGDLYDSRAGSALFNGYNILGRWQKHFSDTSTASLQMYYNSASVKKRINPNDTGHRETVDSFDLDFQNNFMLSANQQVVWGSAIRFDTLKLNSNTNANPYFQAGEYHDHLYSAFLQDTLSFADRTINLTLGSRFEHRDRLGWEIQPTARVAYIPSDYHTIWGAVSRAVRTPSRSETSLSALINFIPPSTEVRIVPNSAQRSEIMLAYELGYRVLPVDNVTFDIALFYNDYSRIAGVVMGTPSATLVPFNVSETSTGIGKGVELVSSWQALSWLKMTLFYSYLDYKVSSIATSNVNKALTFDGTSPRHQWSFRSSLDLPADLDLDFWLRYVDRIPAFAVKEYYTMDVRLGWKPLKNLELSLVGQNLLEPRHLEFGSDFFGNPAAQTERSVYGKVQWSF